MDFLFAVYEIINYYLSITEIEELQRSMTFHQ